MVLWAKPLSLTWAFLMDTWEQVQILAAPLTIQIPNNVPGKAAEKQPKRLGS